MIDTVLFDLDGTLVPYRNDAFLRVYMESVLHALTPLGYGGQTAADAIWKGCAAIYQNDGSRENREAFYDTLARELGPEVRACETAMDEFYASPAFDALRTALAHPRDCRPLIDGLRARGLTPMLFTNPFFPPSGVRTRLGWVNLKPEDFGYVTTFDVCHYAKPNPAYYTEGLAAAGKRPADCIMVGNDAREDMAAGTLGIETYLVTDFLENRDHVDIAQFRCGTYDEMAAYLLAM